MFAFFFIRLPDKLSVTWPEGDELLPNETRFAGTPIGMFFSSKYKNIKRQFKNRSCILVKKTSIQKSLITSNTQHILKVCHFSF